MVHFALAHDRYGGRPIIGRAQVLHNVRNDGAPAIILSSPPLHPDCRAEVTRPERVEEHVSAMLAASLIEWACSPLYRLYSVEPACLIHLEGAGLDFGTAMETARGIRRATVRVNDHENDPNQCWRPPCGATPHAEIDTAYKERSGLVMSLGDPSDPGFRVCLVGFETLLEIQVEAELLGWRPAGPRSTRCVARSGEEVHCCSPSVVRKGLCRPNLSPPGVVRDDELRSVRLSGDDRPQPRATCGPQAAGP